MTSTARAYQALRAVAPGLNRSQYAILLGQALAESGYGDGFEAPDGESSNNWGAIYAEGDLGTLTRTDYTPDGKPIVVHAAWNSTPEVGARQFYNLIAGSYDPALPLAATGDLWGYCRALWRDGPCGAPWRSGPCTRPPYYVGFPPGHRKGLAPAGVELGSPLDAWYRITAYARFVSGGVDRVSAALGWSGTYHVRPPAKPGAGGTLLALALASGGAWAAWRLSRGESLVPGFARRYLP